MPSDPVCTVVASLRRVRLWPLPAWLVFLRLDGALVSVTLWYPRVTRLTRKGWHLDVGLTLGERRVWG